MSISLKSFGNLTDKELHPPLKEEQAPIFKSVYNKLLKFQPDPFSQKSSILERQYFLDCLILVSI